MRKIIWISFLILSMMAILGACSTKTPSTTTTTSTPVLTTPEIKMDQYQLAYRLLSTYPDYFWCDPDVYPIAREGGEQANANTQFPTIQANTVEFAAILAQLNWTPKTNYSDSDKLTIYREHKKITSGCCGDRRWMTTITSRSGQARTREKLFKAQSLLLE